jgi:hypothetical protein
MKKVILLGLCFLMTFTISCKKSEEPSEEFIADEEYAEETGALYLNDLFSGNYEDAYNEYPHDEAMTKAVNPQNYEGIFNSVYEQQGAFKGFSGSETRLEGEYIIFTSGVLFESGALNANVVFNKEGDIAGINFSDYTFELENGETSTDDEIEEIARAYLDELFAGQYENAYKNYPHDTKMTEMVSPEEYESIFIELKKTSGDFMEFNGVEISRKGPYRIVAIGALFELQNYNMNVVFDGAGDIAGLNFTLYTFGEEVLPEGTREIDVEFGLKEWELTGKISLPEAEGVYPALVLVHGSGPNNMNETVGLNEPFKDIAYYLAQKGIAVLRYDKRTYTYGSEMTGIKGLTVYEETIDDAAEAVEFLGNLDYIDKDKIFVLGHSLGGYLMPRIAEKTPEAAGYIMASGIYTSLGEILPYQINYLNNLDEVITEDEQKLIDETEIMAEKILDPETIGDTEMVFGAYKAYWQDLAAYNSIEIARKIEKPVFVFQGDRDYQVPVGEYNLIYEALSNRENFMFKLYPGLNHLLMHGEEKSTPQEYYTKSTVYEPLLDDLIEFIK